MLLCSLSDKYPWEKYNPPYSHGCGLNSTTTVLLKRMDLAVNSPVDLPFNEPIWSEWIYADNKFLATHPHCLTISPVLYNDTTSCVCMKGEQYDVKTTAKIFKNSGQKN